MKDKFSPQRAELLQHILDDDDLEYAERIFPGKVRVLMCRRNSANLSVMEYVFMFSLPPDEKKEKQELRAQLYEGDIDIFQRLYPELWDYIFHRAAEAILALRNGHKSHVTAKRQKKQRAEV